jgi:hypothetical protein
MAFSRGLELQSKSYSMAGGRLRVPPLEGGHAGPPLQKIVV